MSRIDVNTAVSVLANGGVIAYPTEAVWGIGCDPFNKNAVEKIKKLKVRDRDKGLILVVSEASQLGSLFHSLSPQKQNMLLEIRPKPTTWLIEDEFNYIPDYIKGSFSSVAIRISRHPDIVSLCSQFGGMIVSTSANPAGKEPAVNFDQAYAYFNSSIDGYLSGDIGKALSPSQIVDLSTGRIIRH